MGIRRKGRNKGIISGTAALIKKCGLSLIVFELLYKLAAFAIGYPLYLAGWDLRSGRPDLSILPIIIFSLILKVRSR